MLLVFHSKAAADVLMLDQHALPVLKAAGKTLDSSVPQRGVFVADQLGAAIAGIEQAIQQEAPSPDPDEHDDDVARAPAMAQAVSLRQRAYPLLEMLRSAKANGQDVQWEPASNW